MSKHIAHALVLSGALAALPGQAALIAYYPVEGNADDPIGAYDGTVINATLTSGYVGQGYAFNGTNSYISIGLDINPSLLPNLTMGAWVKADVGNPVRQVISHDNGGFDRSLGIDNRGGGTGWSAFAGTGSVLGFDPVQLDDWTFIAVVYEQAASLVTLYVDGTTYSKTGSLSGGATTTRIGASIGFSEYFDGVIDEVFFFSDALSTTELDDIRTNGVLPAPTPAAAPAVPLLLAPGLLALAWHRRRVRSGRSGQSPAGRAG